MDGYRFHIRVLLLIVSVFVVGTLGYWLIEDGWTLFDAFYMTAITITTVGYGEVRELSFVGRVFTVFLIFAGLGSAATFASSMARAFVEQNFREVIEARRMQSMIQRLNDHYIVCGFGGIGTSICRVLKEASVPFVVVEDDGRTADFAAERGYPVVRGKATYDMTLMRAGIERASGVVVCLGDDSVNVYVTLAARELNPKAFIVARGYKADVEKRMIRAGADTVVNPLQIGGEQIAGLIAERHHPSSGESSDDASRVMGVSLEEHRYRGAAPMSVEQLVRDLCALDVLMIRRSEGSEIHRPAHESMVASGDTVLLARHQDAPVVSPESSARTDRFVWTERLSLGIDTLDALHQQSFRVLNGFALALADSDSDAANVAGAFDALCAHTRDAFEFEERYLEENGYPELSEHADEHGILLAQLQALSSAGVDGFPENLPEVLFSWWEEHILESDRAYRDYFDGRPGGKELKLAVR